MNRGYTADEVNAILIYLRAERRRLTKKTPQQPRALTAAARLNAKRFVRKQIRAKTKQFYRYRPLNLPTLLMLARLQKNDFLSGLFPGRDDAWIPILERRPTEASPEIDLKGFSFVRNPRETMEKLGLVLQIEATQLRARLNFDDERCTDIGAFLVLQASARISRRCSRAVG